MKYELTLYITGQTAYSLRACRNLEEICREELEDYTLEVVDILEQPDRAEASGILATPTLIKRLPLPQRKIIGDLSQRAEVLVGLDILPYSTREASR